MFSQSAELYDLIYSTIKDYSREAAQIATLLRTVRPGCRSILDVACGTGEHAHLLATRHRFEVDGLDFDPAFVRIAKAKHSDGQFYEGHLVTNGVVIVEPWFTPEVLEDGRTTTRTAETQGLRVVRVSRTELDGRLSRLWFDYEIHGPDGVRHASEVHELGLFTTDEMLRSFDAAGLVAEHDARGLTGRGLFVARAAA